MDKKRSWEAASGWRDRRGQKAQLGPDGLATKTNEITNNYVGVEQEKEKLHSRVPPLTRARHQQEGSQSHYAIHRFLTRQLRESLLGLQVRFYTSRCHSWRNASTGQLGGIAPVLQKIGQIHSSRQECSPIGQWCLPEGHLGLPGSWTDSQAARCFEGSNRTVNAAIHLASKHAVACVPSLFERLQPEELRLLTICPICATQTILRNFQKDNRVRHMHAKNNLEMPSRPMDY